MNELPPQPPPSRPSERKAPALVGESPLMSLVSACLFLYVGFGLGLTGISGKPLYDGSITALVWGSRVVGVGLLAVALLAFTGSPIALALDVILGGAAAAGCLVIGLIWMFHSDTQGLLLMLFGLLNASAAASAWRLWRQGRNGTV